MSEETPLQISAEHIDQLIKAVKSARVRCSPTDMFHPDFGWVLLNGKPTENTAAFNEWLEKEKL